MRYVFLGAPGAGKGTQAHFFSVQYKIPHIATGDLLRSAIRNQNEIGLNAKSYIDAGKLVPDSVIIDLMRKRLSQEDAKKGFILDGFPRTLPQGEALASLLGSFGQSIERVIYFVLDESILIERIVGRRSCPSCQSVYHMRYKQPERDGFCDCGVSLVIRVDDRPETVKARLASYHLETLPLVDFYKNQGLLLQVEAGGEMSIVRKSVDSAFGKRVVRDV